MSQWGGNDAGPSSDESAGAQACWSVADARRDRSQQTPAFCRLKLAWVRVRVRPDSATVTASQKESCHPPGEPGGPQTGSTGRLQGRPGLHSGGDELEPGLRKEVGTHSVPWGLTLHGAVLGGRPAVLLGRTDWNRVIFRRPSPACPLKPTHGAPLV